MLCDCLHVYMSRVFQTARVAVVKSRDMHWSLLAQRDQRDISLSSLRMLIVADGANPCKHLNQNYLRTSIIPNRLELILNCHWNIVYVVYIEIQGLFRPAMPSSTSFRPVGCGQRWSAHVQVPLRPWLSPSAGILMTLQQRTTENH